MVNVSQFRPSEFVDAKNVLAIDDLLWLSIFVICILDLVDVENISTMLKNCTIDQNFPTNDR
jgi:hypothetical protein